jgi:hypothetical protein
MGLSPESKISQVLSGWKDIANYLGKDVRTLQRYERELGLPVHRPGGKTNGSVIATQSELDAWVDSCKLREPSPSRFVSVLSGWVSLENRIVEMGQLIDTMKKLRLDIGASREGLLRDR